jgi:hypothetical protein
MVRKFADASVENQVFMRFKIDTWPKTVLKLIVVWFPHAWVSMESVKFFYKA